MSRTAVERKGRQTKGRGAPEYRFTVRPLMADEGGGFLIEYPELPGCISDGETIEEALANGREAKAAWLAAMREAGRAVPEAGADPSEGYSGRWVLRTPKSLHRHLAEQAKREGVSLNMLAVTLLAEGIGSRTPWTRAAKTHRRLMAAISISKDAGDLSTLADPELVTELKRIAEHS